MLGPSAGVSAADTSALTVHKSPLPVFDDSSTGCSSQPFNNNEKFKQGRPWCPKCRKPNHTLDPCWRIHGKPPDWKPARERRANAAVMEDQSHDSQPFTKKQLNVLQKLFCLNNSAPSSSLVSTGTVAHRGFGIGRTIGSADLCAGLYLLKMNTSKRTLTTTNSYNPSFSYSVLTSNSNKDSEILI
ncbi:uncharacterized protein [Henckelia pumila]|uniref:uncharacterized protein isoform X2 n=1 Tax=Henckelia pumila TaxID=405737 RepID=UPI003C6DCEAD